MPRKDRLFFLGITLLVLLLNVVPFLAAAQIGGSEFTFDGVLLNSLDGHSYLAKMYQGFRGDWRFTLPYTPNPGQGAFLFEFYLLLGHVARLTGLSLPIVFSISRILAGLLLIAELYRFFEWGIAETRPRHVAFALAALGGGMGWMLIPAGTFTADFWVAETYPFLSIYNNPHFPLGLAIILRLLAPSSAQSAHEPRNLAGQHGLTAILALALSVINPFGVVIITVVEAGRLAVIGLNNLRQKDWKSFFAHPLLTHFLWVMMGGVPMLAYQFWAIRTDPIFSGWNVQNLTPTPPWWDVLAALSPALLLSLAGWRRAKSNSSAQIMLVWAILGLILIFIPFGLQRRFMMGLYIPLAGLAALGLEALSQGKRSRARMLIVALFLLALPTNLIVILAGQTGARAHDPLLYQTREEALGLRWLETETPSHALILAAPGTGLIIPAFSGRQVIYGHPFETVRAEAEKQVVLDFFQTMTEDEAHTFIIERGVDYIFFGPRERAVGDLPITQGLELAFEAGGVQIYAVEK